MVGTYRKRSLQSQQRMYAFRLIKNLSSDKIFLEQIYNSLIRSLLEYSSPLFVCLLVYLEDQLLTFTKRCHRIAHGISCECTNFYNLKQRRLEAAVNLFTVAEQNPRHPLHSIIPPRLPRCGHYFIELSSTARRMNSFVPYTALYLNSI